MMSIHFKGKCEVVKNIVCNVPCETKYKKRQPNLIMQGFCNSIEIKNDIAFIN